MAKHAVQCSFVLFLIVLLQVYLVLAIQPMYNVTQHISLEGFNSPEGIALGNNGEIFVSDSKNHCVKRIDSNSGTITIVAGNGTAGFDTNTNATSAKLNYPIGLSVASNGKLLIVDSLNHAIREVSNGTIKTIAGKLGTSSFLDGATANSLLNLPKYISTLSNGEIYFTDSGNMRIRKISTASVISTLYTASAAIGIAVFSSSEMIVSESNSNRIQRLSPSATSIGGVSGFADGPITSAQFNSPTGISYGPTKEIYIADTKNHVIRLIEFIGNSGIVSTISGIPKTSGNDTLKLNNPSDVAVNSMNEVFILDSGNNRIRKLTPYCNSTYFYNVTLNECLPICFGVVQDQVNVCSGRGNCLTPDNCTCLDNTLWTGENCQIPKCKNIIATNSSVCSGRGSCIGANNCTCQNSTNWGGQFCEIPKCANILAGNSSVCLGRGTCIDANICSCTNPSLYTGNNCEIPKCSNISAITSQVCNSKGQCIAPNNCSCVEGYSGKDCELFTCYGVMKNSSNVCSGKGVCNSWNNCTCQSGFYGDNCQYYNCFGVRNDMKSVCSSLGNCSNVDTCNCTKPYYGKNCELYDCYGKSVNSTGVCSSRGICSSIDNCTCSQGYYGNECQKFDCFGTSSLNSTVCSTQGNCTQYNKCNCKQGFYGANCELFDCFGNSKLNSNVCSSVGSCIAPNNCSCQLGYFGSNCEIFNCSRVGNQTVCKNGNQCSSGRCVCSDEWGGDRCEKVKCYSITFDNSTVCSGHGSCSGYNNCTCDKDYYNFDCSLVKCYGILSNNASVCSGKGKCLSSNVCSCQNGYSGSECQYNICYGKDETDSKVCSSHGQCISPNNCKCSKDFVGNECELISVNMDIENGIVYSYSDVLNGYLNDSVIDGCENIIDKNEIPKLGQVELTKCQWRRNNFKLYLGYDYSITNGTIIKTQFGFPIRIDQFSPITSSSSPTIMDFTEIIPSNQDLIIRSTIPSSYHHFKRISQEWTSTMNSINVWLNNYAPNRTVIRIPFNSVLNGVDTFDISLKTLNDKNYMSLNSKTIKIGQSSSPSFAFLNSREENCLGRNDCLFEIDPLNVNSSLSFELFGGKRSELQNKQMIRISTNSSSTLKVTSTQTETLSTLQLDYPFIVPKITTFDFRLSNVNRTFSLNSKQVIVGLESDDPFVKSSTPTSYSWYCYRTSADKSNVISQNLCASKITNQLLVDFNNLGLTEGMLMIGVNLTIQENTYSYLGFIELVNSDISVPKITPDYIPSVYPAGNTASLHCIVESDSVVSEYGWKLISGKLKNNSPNLLSLTSSENLVGNSFGVYLNIDPGYLIEGEWYEFELTVRNSVGNSKVSLSTRIDLKPRFTCSVDNLKNSDVTAYESMIAINCITLPQDRISSIIMEIDNLQNERLFLLSNTLKKTIVTTLPYYDSSNLILRVKMVNEFGSISEFTKILTSSLPDRISWYSNSLISRISYVRDELSVLKQSKPLTIGTINSLNALLSLIIQNNSLTQVGESMKSLSNENVAGIVNILVEMLKIMKDIPALNYQIDEKIVQLIVPSLSNIFKLLTSVSNISMSADLEWWLNWIFTSMTNAKQYYTSNVYKTLLDSKHFDEINNLKTLLSEMYSNNATKQVEMAIYHFEYFKLTGKSTDGGIHVIPLVNQFNSKSFDILQNEINVKISFPTDFTTQIPTLGGNSIIFSSVSMINNDTSNGNIMNVRPSLELSIFNKENNLIKVDNLVNPIIFKFEGLSTSNKSAINVSCIYLDASNNWSQSGIKSSYSITKRMGDLMYFDLECQVSHLSLFTVQELTFINPIIINPPTPTPPTTSSSTIRNTENVQQETNSGAIAAAVIVPILGVFIIITIIVIVVLLVVWMVRRKKSENASPSSNLAIVKSGDIELVYDYLPTQAKYVKPTSAYKFQLDTAYISEVFNPHLRYTNISRIGSGMNFKVTDSVKQCPKTIKIISYKSEDDLNKFLKESVHLMNTTNPHISKINEIFISMEDQKLCIDMEYYEIGDFSKLTNRNFNLSEKLIKQLIYQLCLALEFAHCTEKSIHGNIKISNLLIKSLNTDNIESIITDFGLNHFETSIDPIFASPEMVSGYKYYFNTDIFSLGVVLYQIMTKDIVTSISELYGYKDQKEVVQILRKALGERYSEQVVDLVLSMLEKDNLTRPQAQDILSNPMLAEFKKRK